MIAMVAVQVDALDFLECRFLDGYRTRSVRPHPSCRARGPVDPCQALDPALRARLCPCCRAWPVCTSYDGKCLGNGGGRGRGSVWSVTRRHRRIRAKGISTDADRLRVDMTTSEPVPVKSAFLSSAAPLN